jgi:4-hydroxy-4-methyl-2-oxoglutarate aldolase
LLEEASMSVGFKAGSLQEMASKLFTAVLSDTLDMLGHTQQVLPPSIRPLDDASIMVGRARTALYMDVYAPPKPGEDPYALEITLIDSLKPGEIPVFSCGKTGRVAPWGELLSTAAKVRGASGALMDGLVRDITAIRRIGFPVFHGGIGPLDSKGRAKVMALDVTIEVAGIPVAPGDLVFGDADGVVIVPKAIEAEVIGRAFDKLKGEKDTLRDLQAGTSLRAVFDKYGVL